jgi:predicted anti-sigma-YlaC factor YlaD
MKLECKHVWEHISEYLDKTLDAQLLVDIEKHLENCEVCSAILDSTRNILVLTADERTFELPVGYSKRLHEKLEAVIYENSNPDGESD